MLRTYSQRIFNYCNKENLTTELVYKTSGKVGFIVSGNSPARSFKNESGKHVVQRYPTTENKGRRHTSTITVSILEIKDTSYILQDKDIVIKTQGGSGPGGQHQNKTESAVRMTHTPTGIMVYINGRSQNANKKEARKILESRVSDHYQAIENAKFSKNKQKQVDGGGRGNKTRTYNFIDKRVVDHRLNTKTTKIKQVMKGEFHLLWE